MVITDESTNLVARIEEATERVIALDRKIYDFLTSPCGSEAELEKFPDLPAA